MHKNEQTFEVAEVPVARDSLPKCPARKAISYRLNGNSLKKGGVYWEHMLKELLMGDSLNSVPSEQTEGRGIEACSAESRRLIRRVLIHPLVFASHTSFCLHYPLTLSPDMIWLLIVQGVAEHVNANAHQLRRMFVKHDGKIKITVDRNDLVRGMPNQPWPEVVEEFIVRIREHIGEGTSDLFMPGFSTTGKNEESACQIALMNTVGQYFEYEVHTICGIPRITLEGSPEDWRRLVERVSAFRRFGLDWWIDPLEVVLRQFALASEGKINRPFWNSLYRMQSRSGGAGYYGWLSVFFPYVREAGARSCRSRLIPILASYLRDDALNFSGSHIEESHVPFPRPGELPQGLCSVPFVWEYYLQRIQMEFLGGFIGVEQNPDTMALRPAVGWAVCDSDAISSVSDSSTKVDPVHGRPAENSIRHPLSYSKDSICHVSPQTGRQRKA